MPYCPNKRAHRVRTWLELLPSDDCVARSSAASCPPWRSARPAAAPRCPASVKIPTAIPTPRAPLPISRPPSRCSQRARLLWKASRCLRRSQPARLMRLNMPPCSTTNLSTRRPSTRLLPSMDRHTLCRRLLRRRMRRPPLNIRHPRPCRPMRRPPLCIRHPRPGRPMHRPPLNTRRLSLSPPMRRQRRGPQPISPERPAVAQGSLMPLRRACRCLPPRRNPPPRLRPRSRRPRSLQCRLQHPSWGAQRKLYCRRLPSTRSAQATR
jgi:hypothetical protein